MNSLVPRPVDDPSRRPGNDLARRRPCTGRVLASLVCLGLLATTTPLEAARKVHLAPTNQGDGSGRDAANARRFDGNDLNYRLFADASDPVIELRFAPGTYSLTTFLFVGGGGRAADYVVRMIGDGVRPEEVVLRNDKPFVAGVQDRMVRFQDLRRVEVENLTFDGNWDEKMRLAGHPALAAGYKNQPVSITARTGRIRRVIVRNIGSIGFVPQTRFDNSAGVESFPLAVGTVDVGQEPEGGDPRPWVVEDCEVHNFHAEFGGYGTMIMAGAGNIADRTPAWATTDANRRLILIRRCLVRGTPTGAGVIALGSAGCSPGEIDGGRVTFTDNLVLNASMGFNTDCGRLTNLDFTNSLFLDIWIGGNVNAGFAGMMQRYHFSGNSIRFGLRRGYPLYTRLRWNGPQATSEPTFVLGRTETNELAGLFIGSPSEVRFSGNWFTTRAPLAQGLESLPAEFQIGRKLSQLDMPWTTHFTDATDFDGSGNGISRIHEDFASLDEVPVGRLAKLRPDSAPELTKRRSLPPRRANFRPIGQVERVLPVWSRRQQRYDSTPSTGPGTRRDRTTEVSEPALTGGIEVAIGEAIPDKTGDLRIPVRLVFQPLPGQGETRPLGRSNLWLEITGATTHTLAAITDARGIAEFRIKADDQAPRRLGLRAYHDPRARSAAEGRLDEYQVACSSAELALGTIVRVTASPAVADEKSGQPARLRFTRTPDSKGDLPKQEIYFRVGNEPQSARLGADFELEAVGTFPFQPGPARQGSLARLTFLKEVAAVEVDVVPTHDDILEREWTTVRLIPAARLGYGIGSDSSATIYFYDGPEWTRHDLPAPAGLLARPTALSPVVRMGTNHAVVIAGTLESPDGRQSPVWWHWDLSREKPDLLAQIPASWSGLRARSVAAVGTDGWPVAAGETGNPSTPRAALAGLNLDWNGSIRTTSPNGAIWIGSRQNGREREAVLGRGTASPTTAHGAGWEAIELKAVNDSGLVVGEGRQTGRRRAFRSSRIQELSPDNLLPLPQDCTESGVEAVDAIGNAVGWVSSPTGRRACLWPAADKNNKSTVVEFGRPDGLPESSALGLTVAGEVLAVAGKGGRWEVPYLFSPATQAIQPLQDPAFVWGSDPNEPAADAVAINSQGWVIGTRSTPAGRTGWIARRLQRP